MINTNYMAYDSPAIMRIKTEPEKELPVFKGEKKPDKFKISKDFCKDIADKIFSAYATSLGKTVEIDIAADEEMNATIFPAIAKIVDKTSAVVQSEIQAYVKRNKAAVLMNIRKLAQETGLSLDSITAEEFVRLISSSNPEKLGKKGLSKLFVKKNVITPRHLANYATAQIIVDLYKINVTLRDIMITYDHMLHAGMALETMRFEMTKEGNTKAVEFIQGWGTFTTGVLMAKPKFRHEHFSPVRLSSSAEEE